MARSKRKREEIKKAYFSYFFLSHKLTKLNKRIIQGREEKEKLL